MPVAVVILAILGFLYLLISQPNYRKLIIGGGIVTVLLITVLVILNPSESAYRTTRIAPEELIIDQLEYAPTLRGATITGRVQNTSPIGHVREIVLDMRLYDCPPDYTELTECLITGDATAIARPDIPPLQTRGFTVQFLFSDTLPLSGKLVWTLTPSEIGATRATD